MKLTALCNGQYPSHVLFDLDGTLVDSATDLAVVVDQMLTNLGYEPAGEKKVRAWVGNGTEKLIRRALAGSLDESATDRLPADKYSQALDMFMTLYTEQNGQHSDVFPRVLELVEKLAAEGTRMAVVTNKLTRFTDQLLERSGLARWFDVRVCGDTLPVMKPDPRTIQLALERLGGPVTQALMVGDSETDINVAAAAGIKCIAVSYGYNHGKPIREQGADLVVDSLAELL